MTADAAIAQATDELSVACGRLHSLGLAFCDPMERVAREQLATGAATVVAILRAEGDDELAGETCLDLMNALWPNVAPEDAGRADWWRTPLGQLCARSLGRADAEAVSYSVAAAMLGIAKGSVSVMVQRGNLDRHPDGGVLRASVLQRIGR